MKTVNETDVGSSLKLFIACEGVTAPERSDVARIGEEITFDINVLKCLGPDRWKPVHQDLLTLTAAVEYADRRLRRGIYGSSRTFHITLPVVAPHAWRELEVQKRLSAALKKITGDIWNFSFVEGDVSSHCEPQECLSLSSTARCKHVMPYSDGLDSLSVSGHYLPGEIGRIRLSGNARHTQKFMKLTDEKTTAFKPIYVIPFKVDVKPAPESSGRSRGFKFAIIAAMVCHLAKVPSIIVPESGQGALGSVIVPFHNTFPDYRNHPVFFRAMEKFIDEILGYEVQYEQPQLWSTKSRTIANYRMKPGVCDSDIINTRSCWQIRWNTSIGGADEKRRQCGLCAACILRRFSLEEIGCIENGNAYLFSNLKVEKYKDAHPSHTDDDLKRTTDSMAEYGIAGVQHFQRFAELTGKTDDDLRVHVREIAESTNQTEDDTMRKLRELAKQHADEWIPFVERQGKDSFIHRWATGGVQ